MNLSTKMLATILLVNFFTIFKQVCQEFFPTKQLATFLMGKFY